MPRLMLILTIANTIMYMFGSSPWHLLGAISGVVYLFVNDKDPGWD